MLSHNNEELDHWFQRLNAPLKHLPAQERVEIHAEVRQHLEALAAANEELGSPPEEAWQFAMAQFGNPTQIGRRLRREAMALLSDPNRWAVNPLMAAFIHAFVHCAGVLAMGIALGLLVVGGMLLVKPELPISDPWSIGIRDITAGIALASPFWAGWATGRRMKQKAVEGTFCVLLPLTVPWAMMSLYGHHFALALTVLACLGGGCLASWIAGRHKKMEDFCHVQPA